MNFYDETLYGRDDEMDEYGDSGAYGESLEEELEDEEEEEETGLPEIRESETVAVVEVDEPEPKPVAPARKPPATRANG